MSRIFITGSTDGLGLMAAELLLKDGHQVTLHARNQARAAQARTRLPGADAVVIGDVSAIEGMQGVAEQVNALGRYDAVIHNAGVGYREPRRIQTADGLSHVFAINVLAPYLLTALIIRPQRLVYLSPGAPDDVSLGPVTQAWLAAGDDPRTDVTGEYFYHQKVRRTHPAARDPRRQAALLDYCAALASTPLSGP
jgi:nucleoside-diphosphate-sugar epimerase